MTEREVTLSLSGDVPCWARESWGSGFCRDSSRAPRGVSPRKGAVRAPGRRAEWRAACEQMGKQVWAGRREQCLWRREQHAKAQRRGTKS